ncbi:hypothetical protein BDV38DRAFT_246065 [Aspergillus pseudotamarii]|uniref:Uncharacterized protein n=1 Tax=Aspergillus pseudotamarii TaxID=132259 RepID=A0A5N6SSN7_ASPPS|nr:uncharacterized protein BDV38DRAFT_246065 [Aspergillus pseudotamarii]KAE8137696.1 hypothetical protein BDV38DRAFT_246065 [Aspergillus pseudotamarii]
MPAYWLSHGVTYHGTISNCQGDTNFSGLQLFGGITCLLGACAIAAAAYLLGNLRQSKKI